jgi:tRNA 2-thiouridine synthesizing protein A
VSNTEIILDVKGLECPEPIRRAKLALAELGTGHHLRVLTTDPVAPIDFEAFCYHLPHELLSIERLAQHIEILLKKG